MPKTVSEEEMTLGSAVRKGITTTSSNPRKDWSSCTTEGVILVGAWACVREMEKFNASDTAFLSSSGTTLPAASRVQPARGSARRAARSQKPFRIRKLISR